MSEKHKMQKDKVEKEKLSAVKLMQILQINNAKYFEFKCNIMYLSSSFYSQVVNKSVE